MSLRLVLRNIASSSQVYFLFLEFKEFNETIIPFVLVGYETGYIQLGATRLAGHLPSHIQRALME